MIHCLYIYIVFPIWRIKPDEIIKDSNNGWYEERSDTNSQTHIHTLNSTFQLWFHEIEKLLFDLLSNLYEH